MIYILDRFEEGTAILTAEDGVAVTVCREALENAREGDVFRFDGERFIFDKEQTEKRKRRIRSKFKSLVKNKRRS